MNSGCCHWDWCGVTGSGDEDGLGWWSKVRISKGNDDGFRSYVDVCCV